MDRDARFSIRNGVMFNRVGDEIVLLDLDKGTYLGLDPVGSRFWDLITDGASINEAIDTMLAEFEVSRSELETDIEDFIAQLEQHELVVARG